jgi:MFS family permease
MLALACSVGLVPLNSTMIAVAIPSIAADFAIAPATVMQWLVTSYLLVNIVAQSPAGKLGDRWGHARILTAGQLIFALGSVLGFLGHNLPMLAGARILMAIGGAIMVPAAMATIRLLLPEHQRARAFGLFGAVMGFSAAVGPLIGGEIAARFGWAALFLVNTLPLAAIVVLELRNPRLRLPAPAGRKPAPFDVLGSLLLGLGLALIVVGARSPLHWQPLVGSGIGILLAFGLWEQRIADPVVDLRLFRRRAFAAGSLIVGMQNFVMYALLFELPLVFSRCFNATAAQTGRALLAMTLAMVAGSMLGGRLAERVGFRHGALAGALLALLGGLLPLAFPLTGVPGAIPSLLALGLGIGISTPAANAAAMSAARAHESGMASAASSTVRYLGGIAGVALISSLVAGSDLLGAQHHSNIVFACALVIACLLAACLPAKASMS